MGQSFTIVNADQRSYMSALGTMSSKLMVRSYFTNDQALFLMFLLADSKARELLNAQTFVGSSSWSGDCVVLAGDYANRRRWLSSADVNAVDKINQQDAEWYQEYGLDSDGLPNVTLESAAFTLKWPNVIDRDAIQHLFGGSEDPSDLRDDLWESACEAKKRLYAVNISKEEYVDLGAYYAEHRGLDLVIDPLMLLIADGNGRGNGDYHGWNEEHVGAWVGGQITVSTKPPAGFQALNLRFCEEFDPVPTSWIRVKAPIDMDFRT